VQYSTYETNINDSDFPVNAFVISLESVTWHWHNEYEMIGILSGSMVLCIQGEEKSFSKGDLCLINARELHSFQKTSDECICMIVQVPESFFALDRQEERCLHFYLDSKQEELPKCGLDYFYYHLAKITYENMRNAKASMFRVRSQVFSLIADLLEFSLYDIRMKNRAGIEQQNVVIEVISYLEKNLMNPEILQEVCLKKGMSRKTLDRTIDAMLSISAKELLDNIRVEKAKNLLRYSGKSIAYIMDICGYSSENTFYRNFKKSTGLTPKEYRESVYEFDGRDILKGYLDYETPKVMAMLKTVVEDWEEKWYCR